MPNVGAEFTASIIIDKNDIMAQALKQLSTVQKELEQNKLEIYFDLSNADLSKKLKEYQKQLSSTDYTIKINNNGIEETCKSLDKLLNIVKKIASGKNFGTGNGSGSGSGGGIGNSIVDEKQLKIVIDLFTKMESHLSSIKKVFSDVGDGNEFSPLLKTLNSIEDAVNNVKQATSNIKLNLNLDVGNEVSEKANQKVSRAISRQLQAYRNLFSEIKGTGKANKEIFNFFEPENARATEIVGMYQGIIKRAEEQYKVGNSSGYKKVLGSTYDDLKKEIRNANAQLHRAENSQSGDGVLSNLFGNTNDLTDVINQLTVIVSKLDEISVSANKFADVFKSGLNINASVEEIDKLTNRVKELESELAKIKTPATGVETNISLGDSEIPKKDKYAKRSKISEEDFLNYSPTKVNKKLSNSGYTILGETVNTELVNGLVKVSAKIKDADGAWKSFSAKVDADGNIFEQRFRTITNGVDKLETALENFGRETSPALTYQETLDKAQKIKNSLNLGDEYSIKVDSSEFVTITKKLTDIENAGTSVTQTFKSAQDAIDNFGKAASNSAEKTSVALKSVKNKDQMKDTFPDKDVSASVESATNSIKEENNVLEQNTQKAKENAEAKEKMANADKEVSNVNLSKYDNRLESYNKKTSGYDATINRFGNDGWTSDVYLEKVNAIKDAVKEYKNKLDGLKSHPELVTEKQLNELDELEKRIKENIAAISNMSAAEKGFTQLSGQKAMAKINALVKENSNMSRTAKNQIKAWYDQIKSGNPSASLDVILGKVQKIVNAEVEAGRAGKSMWSAIKEKAWYGVASAIGTYFGFNDILRYGGEAISTIVQLDDALVDLKKTTAMSGSELENFYYDSNDVAKQMGVTTQAIIEQASSWSRLNKIGLLYGDI